VTKIFIKTSVFFLLLGAAHLNALAEDALFTRISDKYEDVRVERVIKSNLIVLDTGKKVRLIGLKPLDSNRVEKDVERDKHGFVIEDTSDPTTPIEDQASDFAQELLLNKKVRVEFDAQSADESGYVWGYVFLPDGTMANAETLRQGFAQLQIQPPNTKYAEKLREAYREARQEKRGIHAE
jgi:micrococcal nuclease